MAKKIKKRTRIKILPLICIFGFIVLFLGIGYLVSLIPLKNIYIIGNHIVSDQEIIELAGIENYPSFLEISESKLEKKVLSNKYIKKVKVEKKLFAKIYIRVEENKLLYRDEQTGLVVLDTKEEIDDNNFFSLPILLNYVPDTKFDSFISNMSKVNEDIKKIISEIMYDPNEQDDDRFLLHMNDGNDVYLTLTKFKQVNYYQDVLEKLDGKKGILYLDSGNHFQIME